MPTKLDPEAIQARAEGEDPITGHAIVGIRRMTAAELKAEGWTPTRYQQALVLVLDNGTKLYASQDEEGNGPGALFGALADGNTIRLGIC
jgi:hypothetical protein